jgi:hypothetical protein
LEAASEKYVTSYSINKLKISISVTAYLFYLLHCTTRLFWIYIFISALKVWYAPTPNGSLSIQDFFETTGFGIIQKTASMHASFNLGRHRMQWDNCCGWHLCGTSSPSNLICLSPIYTILAAYDSFSFEICPQYRSMCTAISGKLSGNA